MSKLKSPEIGDILVYPDRGIVGFFSNGYGHVSAVVEVNKVMPIVRIGEAHLWTENDAGKKISGVLRKTFNEKWNVRQFRVKGGLTDEQKKKLVEVFTRDHEGKDIYGIQDFPKLWFWGTILQPLGLGNIKPAQFNEHIISCANLWDVIYLDALGIDLFPNMRKGMVTPGQFVKSPILVEV